MNKRILFWFLIINISCSYKAKENLSIFGKYSTEKLGKAKSWQYRLKFGYSPGKKVYQKLMSMELFEDSSVVLINCNAKVIGIGKFSLTNDSLYITDVFIYKSSVVKNLPSVYFNESKSEFVQVQRSNQKGEVDFLTVFRKDGNYPFKVEDEVYDSFIRTRYPKGTR